jgi:hypothetical protein
MKAEQKFYLRHILILSVALWMFGPLNVAARDPGPLNIVSDVPIRVEGVPSNEPNPFEMGGPLVVAENPDVNVSNIGGNESEVSIDVNPTNPDNQVIVGHSPNFDTMNTFFTMDGGQTWTLVRLGNAQDGLTRNFRFDPSVAFDDDGNVYVAYLAGTLPRNRFTTSTAIVLAKSTDGGRTYTQFSRATDAPDNPANMDLPGVDKMHLATGPDSSDPTRQNVYIAFIGNDDEAGQLDQRVFVIGSRDGGRNFRSAIIVNDASRIGQSLNNRFPDPAVGPNGEVYVAWNNSDTGEIFVDVSLDGDITFGTDRIVTTSAVGRPDRTSIRAQPDRGIRAGPTIDVDRSGGRFNGRLYITYTDFGSGGPGSNDIDVFVQFSDDRGNTWSPRTRVNDDPRGSQFLPWLDVDQVTGNIAVVWYDTRNDPGDEKVEVFMAVSPDGGVSFRESIQVSDGQSDQSQLNPNRTPNNYLEYIGIACFNDTAYVVWADNSRNLANLDFFTDQVSKEPVSIVVNNLVSLSPLVISFNPTPVPNGPAGTFTITATFTNTSSTSILNPLFQVVELSGGNLLLNADGGPGGVGARLTPNVSDGVLSPSESFTVDFLIGLQARERFTFFVNLLGMPSGEIGPVAAFR